MQVTTGSYPIPEEYKRQLLELRRLQSYDTSQDGLPTGGSPFSVNDLWWFKYGVDSAETVVFCGTVNRNDIATEGMMVAYATYFNQLFEKNQGIRAGNTVYYPELLIMDDLGDPQYAQLASRLMFGKELSIVTTSCHYYLGTANPELAPFISAWAAEDQAASSEVVMVSPTWWNSVWLDAWPAAVSVRPKPDLSSAVNLLHEANDVKTVAILYDLHRMNYHILDSFAANGTNEKWSLSDLEKLIQKNTSSPNWREETGHWPYAACASVFRMASANNMEVLRYEPLNLEGNQMATIAAQAPDLVVTCMGENRTAGYQESRCDLLVKQVTAANLNPKAFILTGCAETLHGTWMDTHGAVEARMFLTVEPWSDSMKGRISDKSYLVFDIGFDEYLKLELVESDWQRALAWAACDLLVHAIEKAGTIHDPKAVAHSLRNITDSDILHPILGNISIDSRGQNQAPMLVLQYQQANEGLNHPGEDLKRVKALDPVIVAPEVYASGPVWYPMPSFDELQCFRNDVLPGKFGFNLANVSKTTPTDSLVCSECPPRAVSLHVGVEVSINSFQPNASKNVFVRSCVECDLGTERVAVKIDSPAMDTYACQVCPPGHKGSAEATRCEACPSGSYAASSGASECLRCSPGRSQRRAGQSNCEDCGSGTVSVSSGASECLHCPKGSICGEGPDGLRTEYVSIKGWHILTQDEFDQETWQSENVGLLYPLGKPYECPYHRGEACQGNAKCYTSEGIAHMEGPMCGRCAAGFERANKFGLCHKCSSYIESVFVTFLNSLWMMMYIVILIWESCCVSTPSGTRQIRVLILKQAMDFAMMCDIIISLCEGHLSDIGKPNELGYGWSFKPVLDVFVYLYGVRSLPPMEVASACYMHHLYPDTGTHFSYITFAFLMVPLWMLLSFLGFACCKFVATLFAPRASRHMGRSLLFTLWSITIWFVHFRIVRMLGIALQCDPFDVMRVSEDPSFICWQGEAFELQLTAAIGLLVLGVGLPILLHLSIRSYRRRISDLHNEEATRVVGFFYVGYRPEASHWECAKMAKRAICQLLPLLPVFHRSESGHSASAALLIPLMISATWHYFLEPYDARFARIQYTVHNVNYFTLLVMLGLDMLKQASGDDVAFFSLKITQPVKDTAIAIFFWIPPLFCHGFMLLVLFQSSFVNVAAEMRLGGWTRFFSSGSVEVYDHLLGTRGMSRASRRAFLHIIRIMTSYHLKDHGAINWDMYERSLQELVLETAYWSELQQVNDNSCLEIRKADQRVLKSLHPDFHPEEKPEDRHGNHTAIRPSRRLRHWSLVTNLIKRLSGDESADEFYIRALDHELQKLHSIERLKKLRRFRGKRVSLDRMNEVMWEFGPSIIRRILEEPDAPTSERDPSTFQISMDKVGIESLGSDVVRTIGFTVVPSTMQIQTMRLQELKEFDADLVRVTEREDALKSVMTDLQANITKLDEESKGMRQHIFEHGTCDVADSLRGSALDVIEEDGIGVTVISAKNLNIPRPESLGSKDGNEVQEKLSVKCLCMLANHEYSFRTGFTTPGASFHDNDDSYVWDHHVFLPEFKAGDALQISIFVTHYDERQSAGDQAKDAFLGLYERQGGKSSYSMHSQHFSDEINHVDSRFSGQSDGAMDEEIVGIAILESEAFFPHGFDNDISLEDTTGAEFTRATVRLKIDPCNLGTLHMTKKEEIKIAQRLSEAKKQAQKTPGSEHEHTKPERQILRAIARHEKQERRPGNSINNKGGANLSLLEAEAQHHRKELEELRSKRLQFEESLAQTRGAAAVEATAVRTETDAAHTEAPRIDTEAPRAETWEHAMQQHTDAGALPSRDILQEQLGKLQAMYAMPFGDSQRLWGNSSARSVDAQLSQSEDLDNQAEASALEEIEDLNKKTDKAFHELEFARDHAEGLKYEVAMLMKSILSAGFDVGDLRVGTSEFVNV